MKAQKDALFFALGLLVGIVVAHSVVASRSVTRSQVEENGFRLVRERIGSATKAHRKAIQEYVRHYRAAYRDDLNIKGADENAREEMDERGTVMNDGKFALVVSVYKEWGENNEKVPEWANANASRDNYFVVQPFYQRIEASKPAFVVNKGFESGVYMRYIVDNYHNLPEAVIFVQADGCEVDMNAVLPRVTLEILDQAGGFLPLNCLKVMGRSILMWGGEKGERVEACWREVSKHFELNLFKGFALGSDFQINMVCCACFAVKRELLLSTPFEVWNSFYERSIVKGQCIEGQLDIDEGKHETAGTFEHLAHVIFGRKEPLWEPKCISDFDQNQKTSFASEKNIVHEGPNDTKVNEPVVQNTIDRIEKWQPKYSPEKAEQCLAQKYKGVQNGSMAQSSTNILVYGNSVSRRFYQLLSAYLLSISGTEEDALAAQEHRLMTRQEEKVECNKALPGISCSTEIIYQEVNLGQRKIVVYFHFEQRIYSKNLEAVINETAPQIVIGNAGLDNYFCQHALHDEPRCGEDKSLSSIQNSLEGSAEWEEQIKTWKLNLVERADKLAELVNSAKSKFGTKFVWRKSTCMCTKWNSMPSSIDHSKHNETLLHWFLNTSDSIVQERLKLDSSNILDASDLTRLNTEPYAKVCELYEDHVHPKRRIHDILIDNMLVLLCSAEPKGNVEENRVEDITNDFATIVNNEDAPGSLQQSEVHATDRVEKQPDTTVENAKLRSALQSLTEVTTESTGNLEENRVDVTVNSQKAKENTTETLPEAFRLLSNKLMKNQYRDSCTAACFYSTKITPDVGLGSRLQFIVAALTFAIEDGCVLIASPDSSLQLFGGSSLKELTNCKDEDAKDIKYIDSGASDMDENGLLARYMRYVPQFDDLGFKGSIMLWQSVALSFFMRATESFASIIQEVQNEIGWYDIQKCRGAVISMHVRHGDKGYETSLLPLSAYLKELALWLENAEQNQEFKCIFVATDDGDLQKRLEDSPVFELESGRKFKVIGSWQSNVAAQKLSSSEGEFGALLDLHLLSRAKTFCFTFSSNFGRLAMHMNPVHLEARAVSSLIPMDYYHHAISSGFFFVHQQNVRRGSWSTVAVYKEKISSKLNCEPQHGCSAQTFDSSQNETYSCCRLPAKSDYVNGVIGPVLSEIFPDEYEKYCRVIDDF